MYGQRPKFALAPVTFWFKWAFLPLVGTRLKNPGNKLRRRIRQAPGEIKQQVNRTLRHMSAYLLLTGSSSKQHKKEHKHMNVMLQPRTQKQKRWNMDARKYSQGQNNTEC